MTETPVFPLCYSGSLEYFAILFKYESILIDQNEFVPKQTTRSFLEILNANGIQKLSVPINNKSQKIPYHLITIDNKQRWQHQHWKSILSAYKSSPFFEHYEHYIADFYQKKYDTLFEFNSSILINLLKALKVNTKLEFSNQYLNPDFILNDFRNKESFKKTRNVLMPEYYQTFSYKHHFVCNLSILDLIFNLGPDSKTYLSKI
jgi:hypothetical protein